MIRLLLPIAIAVLLCSSCESTGEDMALPSASPSPTFAASAGNLRVASPASESVIISLTPTEFAVSKRTGKDLLEEYQVQPGQTIRFPYESYLFESHGDVPVTSIEAARSKYPGWIIPETLGSYAFQDLTLYQDRTTVVDPNLVPTPKAEIAVLEDEASDQYYLCYGDASGRFVVNVHPDSEVLQSRALMFSQDPDYRALPSCPGAWLAPAYMDPSSFSALLMTAESDTGYEFLIRKISGSDCLESETIPFSEEEAQAIYAAIQAEF